MWAEFGKIQSQFLKTFFLLQQSVNTVLACLYLVAAADRLRNKTELIYADLYWTDLCWHWNIFKSEPGQTEFLG